MKSTHRTTQGMLMHLSMHNLDSTSIAYNWGIAEGTARTMGSAIRQGTFPCASTSVIEIRTLTLPMLSASVLSDSIRACEEK